MADARLLGVPLTRQSMGEVLDAWRRSVPRSRDAVRLFELVEERLGDRGIRDWYHGPSERGLLLRAPEHPDWVLPHRLLLLDDDLEPEPVGSIELPGKPEWPGPGFASQLADTAGPVILDPGGRPARLDVHEGPVAMNLHYGRAGTLASIHVNGGEHYAYSHADEGQPFRVDPRLKPPRHPPLSLLLSDDWRAEGHPLHDLADRLSALRPELRDLGRVHTPCREPGNAMGAWHRGLRALREAAWDGRVADDHAGWVVIDAWNGTALATGATLGAAFEAWREEVSRVQPLPPVPEPSTPTEPTEPAPAPSRVEEGPRSVTLSFEATIRIEPPVLVDWASPRPEHTPAAAVRTSASPPLPEALAAAGFTRVSRLFSEHGEEGFAFVRRDVDGWTLVGDDAAGAVDPTTLDGALEAGARVQRAEFEALLARFDHPRGPDQPVELTWFQVWDPETLLPTVRVVRSSWTTQFDVQNLDLVLRHQVLRVRERGIAVA